MENKVGKVGQIYTDDQTGQPSWITVNTGLFGTNESFVPIREASFTDDGLTVPYGQDQIKDAPNVAADGHLSPDEEQSLYAYYGMDYATYARTDDADRSYQATDSGRDYSEGRAV